MGASYELHALDEQAVGYLASLGIAAPEAESRAPSCADMRAALGRLTDHAVDFGPFKVGRPWEIDVRHRVSPETESWVVVRTLRATEAGEPCSFEFSSGWPQLMAAITIALAGRVGPLLLVPDTGEPPAIVEATSTVAEVMATWTG